MKKIFTLLTVLGLSVIGLKAQVWSGTTSSDWSVATNWVGGAVPTETGTVRITAGVPFSPVLAADTKIGSLTIDPLTTLNLNGKTLTVVGTIAGTGQLIGSATSGLYAGGTGSIVFPTLADVLPQFSASPVSYFEDFANLETPIGGDHTSIEFGNADLSYDISVTTTQGAPAIYDINGGPGATPGMRVIASNSEIDLNNNIVLTMQGAPVGPASAVTAFSALVMYTALNLEIINGAANFIFRIKFEDGTEEVKTLSTPITGNPVQVGFVSNRPIAQVIFETTRARAYLALTNIRIGRRADFGSINMDQTGANNTLGSLTVDLLNSNIATLGGNLNVATSVAPISGTLQADGKLRLLSSATGTAMVASHTEAGKITGNVTVERYIPGGRKHQWRFLGFPYSGPLALTNISGAAFDFNIPNTNAPSTIKYFDPTLNDGVYGTGNSLGNAGYRAIADINGQISSGQGVATWLYGSTPGTATQGTLAAPMTIASTGVLNETGASFSQPFIVGNNNGNWNLIANPFASTIDWESAGITKGADISSTIYRWDPEAANWTTYTKGSGAFTGNGSRYIESGAAFFVSQGRGTAGQSIDFAQTAKVADAGSSAHFSRNGKKLDIASQRIEAASSNQLSGLRVKASGTGNPIPADIYLDLSKSDATSAYDNKYDAIAMGRSSGANVKFVGEKDALAVQFDAPIKTPGTEKRYYPLMVTMPQAGNGQIDLSVEGSWNTLNTVSLIDTKDNKTIPMVGGKLSYAFKMQDLKEDGRFILAINHVAAKGADNGNEVTVRVLNNPVRSETIQALISHPNAKAKNWSVLSASGSAMSTGQINPSDASVQHELKAGKLNSNGVYYLKVNFENGDSKTVRFVKL